LQQALYLHILAKDSQSIIIKYIIRGDIYNWYPLHRSCWKYNCFFGLSSYLTENTVSTMNTVSLASEPTSQKTVCLNY